MVELVRVPEAARRLGISYPTLKQWIYRGKIRTVRTAGGHHRVPVTEIDRLLFQRTPDNSATRRVIPGDAAATGLGPFISGRNQLVGRIIELEIVGLLAKVKLDIGGQTVTSIITRDAARELRLRVGETAAALIKATEVMIIRPPSRRR
jgi:molybdopterin-binding protein